MNIVLDKSFLDGASSARVMSLCADNTILFSQTLMHEVMTTNRKSQKRCFSKLPEADNPVTLIESVGPLMHFELENSVACTPLSERTISVDFSFNEQLREGVYVPQGEAKRALDDWKVQVAKDTQRFITRCETVKHLFPEIAVNKDLHAATDDVRERIAEDHDLVRTIYKSFRDEAAPSKAPSPESLNPQWALFRWVQCQILSALRMYRKYQGKIPSAESKNVFTKAEHTMHDIYYTILGSLAGALATKDQEIIEDFLLVCPQGMLIEE